MDGFSRFVKFYLLKSKTEGEVNMYMKQYIAWAERQRGSRINEVISRDYDTEDHDEGAEPVKQVLTDKGQKFCNGVMENCLREEPCLL
ncbi:unnamed protein product [Peronospora belbahrii]|uniref:Core-binding (CB) domain-containing protein n=1 Tax=Peronospora belbahrii TaxID=622444 RepID=A0AAU9KT23_9STRA|nr:unnamed protein product [Peronospora belbahrii]